MYRRCNPSTTSANYARAARTRTLRTLYCARLVLGRNAIRRLPCTTDSCLRVVETFQAYLSKISLCKLEIDLLVVSIPLVTYANFLDDTRNEWCLRSLRTIMDSTL